MPSVEPPTTNVAKPNPRNNPIMFKIFQNVQYNVVQHKKYVKEMVKLYRKLNEESFRESFKNALHYLFTFGDASGNVDRVIQFVATFCTSLDDEEEFLLFIFEIIFDCQCVSGQSVRFRASQLLAAVLSALGEDASLDDDLCDKLLASQMQRLQDTRGAVRCRAALALQRLQCPTDPDDEVTRAYRFHMSCDPSASVRRAIVMTIAKCSRNNPFVLERLCDVDESVRRAAFLHIAAINVTQLRVRQRLLTLKVGLTERSQRVRRVVEEILIPGWLSTFQGNIVNLLKAIRLDNAQDAQDSQYVAGKLLESLFKRLPVSELLEWLPTDRTLRLIPADKLNKETAWYWRHLAEHLHKIDDDETLEVVLPDLVVLAGYIRAILESPCPEASSPEYLTRQHVLHELARMLRVYDTSDVAARQAHHALVTDALTGDYGPLSPDVIRAFVSALELVVPDVFQRIELICNVINSLRDPPEPDVPVQPPPPVDSTEVKMQRARLRVSLNVAIEAQEEAVQDQNYALAAECKAKVDDIQKKLDELTTQAPPPPPAPLITVKEKLSDAATLNKCLTILNSALDTPQLNTVTPLLQLMFNELEVEIFQNPEVLETALETVALYGMLDKNFARDNKPFFFANLIDTTNETVVSTVLKCIVDLLCVHGATVFDHDGESRQESKMEEQKRRSTFHSPELDEDGSISDSVISLSQQTHNTVIELLLKIMDGICANYRLIIVEGLCRLLHLGHLESPAILSRLLLLWFNPATIDEDMLRQTIGVFFQTFPACVDGAQDQIQKATIPTLKALANAPSSSPLAEIDQEAVVKFIVTLTRINHELIDSQGGMAYMLCSHLARRNNCMESALICRVLSLLSPPREAHVCTQLAGMLRELCQKVPDKQSCRYLTKYLGSLEAMERASLNKMSSTEVTEATIQAEDTLSTVGRATSSLPAPLARSTHVVINETVEEEVEIDETSPTEVISRISEESTKPELLPRKSTDSTASSTPSDVPDVQSDVPDVPDVPDAQSDSSGVSPVKKVKVAKGKNKLSTKKKSSPIENKKSELPKESSKPGRKKEKQTKEKETEAAEKGIKRSRSQRSVVDADRAKSAQQESKKPDLQSPPLDDLDISNVTVRRSTKPVTSGSSGDSDGKQWGSKGKGKGKKNKEKVEKKPARSTRSSASSVDSSHCPVFDDSADDTELHTIVYDQGLEQSLLQDSAELDTSKRSSKGNITIPETPDASEESDSEPEPIKTKAKNTRNGKKT